MYLDDTLTAQELIDTRDQQREDARRAANPHGIPRVAMVLPDFLKPGDMVALYAGNPFPSHVTTVDQWPEANPATETVTVTTTDGRFDLPESSLIWVAAWAPID